MRQRVGFARALVAQPEVLCMDEPFSALDVLTAESLRTEVVDLWRGSGHAGLKSIFLVTHNIVEAVFIATRIVIISSHPGRVRNVIANPLPFPRDVNSQAIRRHGRPGPCRDHGIGHAGRTRRTGRRAARVASAPSAPPKPPRVRRSRAATCRHPRRTDPERAG